MKNQPIEDLEWQLARLREKVNLELMAHVSGGQNLWDETQKEILILERQIAAFRGDEYAECVEFGICLGLDWTVVGGFSKDAKLCCNILDTCGSVIITFSSTMAMRLGKLNDEVIEGHPLYQKGLDVVGAFIVNNSRWLEGFRSVMQLHDQYDDDLWRRMRHFMFRGKEGDFECLAVGFDVEFMQSGVSVRIE